MASSNQHDAQFSVRAGHTQDEQVITCDNFTTLSLDSPSTPVSRQAPQMNLPPGPKPGYPKGKEQESPTGTLHGRAWNRHNDSDHESRDVTMDETQLEITPMKPWSNMYGRELPKTPTRKLNTFRGESDCRTESPKCPSLNRSRLQSRYYRVRSPSAQCMQSGSTKTPTKHVPLPLIQGELLNFNNVLENKERKPKVL